MLKVGIVEDPAIQVLQEAAFSPLDIALIIARIGKAQVLQALLVLLRHFLHLLVPYIANELLEIRRYLLSSVYLGIVSEPYLGVSNSS